MLHFSVLCFCPFGWLVFLISVEDELKVFRGKRAHGTGTLQGHLPPVWGVDWGGKAVGSSLQPWVSRLPSRAWSCPTPLRPFSQGQKDGLCHFFPL